MLMIWHCRFRHISRLLFAGAVFPFSAFGHAHAFHRAASCIPTDAQSRSELWRATFGASRRRKAAAYGDISCMLVAPVDAPDECAARFASRYLHSRVLAIVSLSHCRLIICFAVYARRDAVEADIGVS